MIRVRAIAAICAALFSLPSAAINLQVVAGKQDVLVANFGLDAAYTSTDTVNPTADVTLTVKSDGTWTVTAGIGDAITSGSPVTGRWVQEPYAGVGQNFQVQFAITNQINTPVEVNDASSFTTVSSDLTVSINRGGGVTATADFTVNLRALGVSSTELTETATFTVDGL